MTQLAVACLRWTNPSVSVVAICDTETDRLVRGTSDPLLDVVDQWVVAETPRGEPNFRNRFVKTSARSIIDGPFLLLDNDVVVRGDLRQIYSLASDVSR